jgi:hypothetical protein
MSSFLKNPTVQIVLGYFPKVTTIALAVVCFALGMVWAYGIAPVQYVNGDPSQLQQSFQDQWVAGAAGRYAARNADNSGNVLGMLQAVDDPQGIVQRLQTDPAYSAIADALTQPEFQQLVQQAQPEAATAPPQPNAINNYVIPLVVIIVFAILVVLAKVLWTLLIFPFIEPIISGRSKSEASKEIDLIKQRNQAMASMKDTAVEANEYGEPIIRQLSMYRRGFGNYDDSFNIETPDKTYYGETGGTIAETIGEDGVTAIEVWMFDKDEFANTPTVIFASEHAYNDDALRSRLENRGDVVKLEPGTKAILETGGLYIEATAREVNYDESAPDPKSVIEESKIEIVAWAKNGADSSGTPSMETTPAPASSTPTGADFPAAPSGGSSQPTPLTPPPLQMPGDDDDDDDSLRPPAPPTGGGTPPPEDPFAGAGDFTPVNPNDS